MPSALTFSVPPCDAHLHLYPGKTFAHNLQMLRGYRDWFGFERLALLSLPEEASPTGRDDAANIRCLGAKAALMAEDPSRPVYALAGLVRGFGEHPDTAAGYVDQARRALDMGFDGFKSLLGKPGLRKWIGIALDDPIFDPFYTFVEESGRPLVFHVGDPANFWDPEHYPPAAVKNGWVYDETFTPLSQLRIEAENVLKKHPALQMTFAHVFFLGEDPDEAERLFSTYPNLGFDLTPGWEMHIGFTRFHDRWHDLFERFRDRFYLGTDSANWHASTDLPSYEKKFGWALELVRHGLEGDGLFDSLCDDVIYHFRPFDISLEARAAIERGNFLRRFGETPAPIHTAAALAYARELRDRYERGVPGTDPAVRETSLAILRHWAASPETLFSPEP